MAFVQNNIAPAIPSVSNSADAYRGAIARLAAAAAAGEDLDDQINALASAFDLDAVSVQAEIDEILPDFLIN